MKIRWNGTKLKWKHVFFNPALLSCFTFTHANIDFYAKKVWFSIMITKNLRKTLIFESIISQLIYGRFINFGVKNCCFRAVITKNQRKPFIFESLKTSLFYSCGQPFFTSKVVPVLWCHLKKETFISESVIS